MRINLSIRVDGQYLQPIGAGIDIPELYTPCFEPLKSGDDSFISRLAGDASNREARIIMKTREDAANILAKELAALIVNEMKRHDTYNGERIE